MYGEKIPADVDIHNQKTFDSLLRKSKGRRRVTADVNVRKAMENLIKNHVLGILKNYKRDVLSEFVSPLEPIKYEQT